jgi:hypothetical protein
VRIDLISFKTSRDWSKILNVELAFE